MNRLKLGYTIQQYRRKQNITQQQLAKMLGVSAGAVSKWETDCALPDITLLKPLARALNINTDQLLSFEPDLSAADLKLLKEEITQLFLTTGYEAGLARCQAYLREYPSSIALKLTAATLIQMYLGTAQTMAADDLEDTLQYLLSLYGQVAASGDPRYANAALFPIL